jgi:WD40 repeat protein
MTGFGALVCALFNHLTWLVTQQTFIQVLSCSANQKIPRSLWNLVFFYRCLQATVIGHQAQVTEFNRYSLRFSVDEMCGRTDRYGLLFRFMQTT